MVLRAVEAPKVPGNRMLLSPGAVWQQTPPPTPHKSPSRLQYAALLQLAHPLHIGCIAETAQFPVRCGIPHSIPCFPETTKMKTTALAEHGQPGWLGCHPPLTAEVGGCRLVVPCLPALLSSLATTHSLHALCIVGKADSTAQYTVGLKQQAAGSTGLRIKVHGPRRHGLAPTVLHLLMQTRFAQQLWCLCSVALAAAVTALTAAAATADAGYCMANPLCLKYQLLLQGARAIAAAQSCQLVQLRQPASAKKKQQVSFRLKYKGNFNQAVLNVQMGLPGSCKIL